MTVMHTMILAPDYHAHPLHAICPRGASASLAAGACRLQPAALLSTSRSSRGSYILHFSADTPKVRALADSLPRTTQYIRHSIVSNNRRHAVLTCKELRLRTAPRRRTAAPQRALQHYTTSECAAVTMSFVEVGNSTQRGVTLSLFVDPRLKPDHQPAVYWPQREPISGRVTLEVSKPIKIRGVQVKLTGKNYVHWSEGSGKDQRSYSQTVSLFVSPIKTLIGQRDNDDGSDDEEGSSGRRQGTPTPNADGLIALQPGMYSYPFTLVIPATADKLPSSFNGQCGEVTYKLKAYAQIPLWINPQVSLILPIGSTTELPDIEPGRQYCREGHTIHSFCCCGDAGHVQMHIQCEAPAFTARPREKQRIVLGVGAAAATSKDLDKLTVKVYSVAIFRAEGRSTTRVEELGIVKLRPQVSRDPTAVAEAAQPDGAPPASTPGLVLLPPDAELNADTLLPFIPALIEAELFYPSLTAPLITVRHYATLHLHNNWASGCDTKIQLWVSPLPLVAVPDPSYVPAPAPSASASSATATSGARVSYGTGTGPADSAGGAGGGSAADRAIQRLRQLGVTSSSEEPTAPGTGPAPMVMMQPLPPPPPGLLPPPPGVGMAMPMPMPMPMPVQMAPPPGVAVTRSLDPQPYTYAQPYGGTMAVAPLPQSQQVTQAQAQAQAQQLPPWAVASTGSGPAPYMISSSSSVNSSPAFGYVAALPADVDGPPPRR